MTAFTDSLRADRAVGSAVVFSVRGYEVTFTRATPTLTVNDWIPSKPPGPDLFQGIDRRDAVRLSGHRVDMTGTPTEDGIDEGYWTIDREGGRANAAWVNTAWRGRLPDVLTVRPSQFGPGGKLTVGFTEEIPEGECLVVQSDTWRRLEWPVTGEVNLVCLAPAYNARVKVEAPPEHWTRGAS